MATTKITSPELFDLGSLNTALQLPSGTTAERPTSPSTGEWRYNTDNNLIEFWDGGAWRDLQDEDIPPVPSENFNTITYTGDGANPRSITGVGFKPDLLWIKKRNSADDNVWFDSTRGPQKELISNSTAAEATKSGDAIISFDSDGFTTGNNGAINANGDTYVAWCWKANGGTTSSNTEGSITSTVQANTKAGFSIATYTGTGSTGTYGHGLSSTPDLIITKRTDAAEGWLVWSSGLSASNYMYLNSTGPVGTDTNAYKTIGATTNEIGTDVTVNTNGGSYIAYCFQSVAGYSKVGTYTGNGTTQVINTGFKPAWILIKSTVGNDNWRLYDTTRGITAGGYLEPNKTDAEDTSNAPNFNIFSNGFEITAGGTTVGNNANGNLYTYYAFASDPSTSTPTLANSFTTNTYTGNGGTKILGTGFNPSLAWLKRRSSSASHSLTNLVRGNNLVLQANEVSAEASGTISLTSTGIDIGSSNALRNDLNSTYVAWSWQGNSLPSINTDGSIQSLVSANQAAGFSVVGWTGTGSAGTLGHGLSSAPELLIVKDGTNAYNWYVYSTATGSNIGIEGLNTTAASFAASSQMTTTSTLITDVPSVASLNTSGANMVIFAFHSVSGFSKIGSYTGSGSDGNAVTTGFQPDFLLVKRTDSTGGWLMFDSARNPSNPRDNRLEANNNQAEQTGSTSKFVDFNSDNFEANGSDSELNASGGTYIYAAFKNNREFAAAGTMAFTVVAGGGGGGAGQFSGTQFQNVGCGGGAGGFRGSGDVTGGQCTPQDNITLASGTYTVTVGAGGSPRVSGSASSIAGPSMTTISTVGGGRGADNNQQAENGGSGGGRSFYSSNNGYSTECEGFGRTLEGLSSYQPGGGGADGIQASFGVSNASGKGVSSIMSGTYEFYAGGGAAGSGNTTRPQAAPGGGGNGQISGETAANTPAEITGTANTGGGGGGGSNNTSTGAKGAGGSGGSGIVILRLKTSEYSGTVTGSPTVTTDGDETIIKFTASGTYVHS